MKKILMTISFLSAFMAFGEYSAKFINAMRKGADTSVEIRISDDDGSPVSNATVHVCYNVGKGRSEVFGKTDGSGVFLFERKTNGYGEIYVTKDGFYNSESRFSFIDMGNEHEVKKGKWQPCPLVNYVLLRPIRNQIPLISKYDGIDIPTTNIWIAFDMEKGEWLPPYGKGSSEDFSIFFRWNGKRPNEDFDMEMQMKFHGETPSAYLERKRPDSTYGSSYMANTNLFDIYTFSWSSKVVAGKWEKRYMNPNYEMIVRTRCHTNNVTGEISFNYGRIKQFSFMGGWNGKATSGLAYDFNPTPNDTNLEPKR